MPADAPWVPFVDSLGALTGLRTHEALSTALVATLSELLHARSVVIYTTVGEPRNLRWLARVQAGPACAAPQGSANPIDLAELPLVAHCPARRKALNGSFVTAQNDGAHMYRYPLRNGHGSVEVLEVLCADVLDGAALRLVDATLTVYSNMQGLLNYGQRDALTGLLNRKTFDEEFFKARTHILSPAPEPADERRVADGSTRSWVGMVSNTWPCCASPGSGWSCW